MAPKISILHPNEQNGGAKAKPRAAKTKVKEPSSESSSSSASDFEEGAFTGWKWTDLALRENATATTLDKIRFSKCELGDKLLIKRLDMKMVRGRQKPYRHKQVYFIYF